jgi:uncharacterized membrane protein
VATTSRDPDRLVLFTDAVVAIAITLLILPLVDLVQEHKAQASDIITENLPQIFSFVLSFAVIARMWLVHHQVFRHVRAYNSPLVLVNLVWVFMIVLLPFPTEMVATYSTNRFTVGFYIGTIVASSLCQTVLTLIIYHHPEIAEEDDPLTYLSVVKGVSATTILAVALTLGVLVPGVGYYGMLLLLLNRPVVSLWSRLRKNG